jgi:hypothetical protein
MGAAIGRAMIIDGLRIVNYNYKHGREVYDFYDHESLECCNRSCETDIEHVWDENLEMFDNMLNEQEKHLLPDQNCPFVIKNNFANYNDIDLDILKTYEPKLNFLLQHHYSKVQEI